MKTNSDKVEVLSYELKQTQIHEKLGAEHVLYEALLSPRITALCRTRTGKLVVLIEMSFT